MEIIVKINEEDFNTLERMHYELYSQSNLLQYILIDSGTNLDTNSDKINVLMENYSKAFKEYTVFKNYISNTYNPDNDKYTSWSADFEKKEITFMG